MSYVAFRNSNKIMQGDVRKSNHVPENPQKVEIFYTQSVQFLHRLLALFLGDACVFSVYPLKNIYAVDPLILPYIVSPTTPFQ